MEKYRENVENEMSVCCNGMKYHAITSDDMKNGEGLRVVLWVSGCEHRCPGCHNPQTWDAASGDLFTYNEEKYLLDLLKQDHISGITFSGGDPLHPANRDVVGSLALKVSEMGKDVWLYTGYVLEHKDSKFLFSDKDAGLEDVSIDWLSAIDVLVDGRFEQSIRETDILKGSDPHWRGSSNQRLIDVKKSVLLNKVVETVR